MSQAFFKETTTLTVGNETVTFPGGHEVEIIWDLLFDEERVPVVLDRSLERVWYSHSAIKDLFVSNMSSDVDDAIAWLIAELNLSVPNCG